MRKENDEDWQTAPVEFPYLENMRGLGVADMVRGIQTDSPHRCSAEMTYHVVDVMRSLLKSSEEGKQIRLKSDCERPALMEVGSVQAVASQDA